MDQTVENYQLKWHSFSNYLHSCIASSVHQSDSFADVALVTLDGNHVMAHRFVLSACSQYLNQVLKLQPTVATTLPLAIVLPSEITYRTLKILIEYMYSGEATVSKDILEPVLRGGDILKVKGLWRPKEIQQQQDNRLVKVSQNHRNGGAITPNQNVSNKVRTKATPDAVTDNKNEEPQPKVSYSSINPAPSKDGSSKGKEIVDCPDSERTNRTIKCINKPNKNSSSVIKSTEDIEKRDQLMVEQQINNDTSTSEQSSDTMQYLVIKEEPIEWTEVHEADMEIIDEKEVFSTEMTIKPEVCIEEEEDSQEASELYTPLTCELCTETFALPADWVRHVQTHTDMLPAKRQRRGGKHPEDETDAPFPQLHCDLCQKYFPTPAEWVHHIQNTHTEFELHLSNKTAPGKLIKTPKSFGSAHNSCGICTKKFPSHASLLIHKRTHTGEKPYMCELCYKGFNVKSNLLRHLRTVHDKIINPTEVDDIKEEIAE